MLAKIVIFAAIVCLINVPGFSALELPIDYEELLSQQKDLLTNPFSRQKNVCLLRNGEIIREQIAYRPDYEDLDNWIKQDRILYSYNEQVQLVLIDRYFWNTVQDKWDGPALKIKVEWLPDGLFGKLTYSIYIDEQDSWLDTIRYTQEYNNGQIELVTIESLEIGNWVIGGYVEFYYAEDSILEAIQFSNRSLENDEFKYSRVMFEYDGRGRVIETLEQEKNDEDWENYERSELVYHENDNSDYAALQDFLNLFALYTLIGYQSVLHPFGMVEEEVFYRWDSDGWETDFRDKATYDENDLIYMIEYDYYAEGQWFPKDRYLVYHDENFYPAEIISQYFRDTEEEWVNKRRYVYLYSDPTGIDEEKLIPSITPISNYPNPFNPETTIRFNIEKPSRVELDIYNVQGRLIDSLVNQELNAGKHSVVWNGSDRYGNELSGGVYIYRLSTGTKDYTGKMLLLK